MHPLIAESQPLTIECYDEASRDHWSRSTPMSSKTILQAVGLTFMTACAILMLLASLGSGATSAYVVATLDKDAARADGWIIDTRTQRNGRRTVEYVRFGFFDASGTKHTKEEELTGRALILLPPGKRVVVRYSPSNPAISSIKSDRELDEQRVSSWLLLAALSFAGMMFMLPAIFPSLRKSD